MKSTSRVFESLATGAIQIARRSMSSTSNTNPLNWLFFGYGNMAKAVIDPKMIEDMAKQGHKIDIIKTKPSADQIDVKGVKYYYSDSKDEAERMPPEGTKYHRIISGAKPQVGGKEMGKFAKYADDKTVLVSYEAGSTTSSLIDRMGGVIKQIIRTMPNTNATIGRSLTAYCTTGNVDEDALDGVVAILQKAGDTFPIPEDKMNAFTAVAGSGPAYAHLVCGAISRSLQTYSGLPSKEADALTLDVVKNFDDDKYKKGMTPKVIEALEQMEPSDKDGSRGKGSTEGIIASAARALGENYTRDELESLVAGVAARVAKSMIRAAEVSCGFNEDVSHALVAGPNGILKASASYAAKSGKTFLELKNNVTSVDGTTQAALAIGEVGTGRTLDQLWEQAMKAAVNRGRQMGDPLGYAVNEASAAVETAVVQKKDLSPYKKGMAALYNSLRQVFDLGAPSPKVKGEEFTSIMGGQDKGKTI